MFNSLILRHISQLVLLTFSSMILQPVQAAVMAENHKQTAITASQTPAPLSRDERYGKGLDGMREVLERAEKKHKRGERDDDEVKQLRNTKRELEAMDSEVEADFAATGQHLKDAKLPPEILARHEAAVKEFQLKQNDLKQKLKEFEDADNANDQTKRSQKVRELADFMQANQHRKTHTPNDPNKLPFSTPDGKVRAPKETERAFKTSLFKPAPVHLAGPIPNGFTLPATNLPATPTADDLAATEDITLTPAIKAQAASLNNNPVQIYNWVRNNIEYLPTYGSIQGADMTLQTKRGNSFDTASLLVGLLRAAGIPARYVYGTIKVPADQAMNWVGGVTKPEAAQQLMGQGGIPNIGLASGGLIKAIELEHVWVEAYVDYVPSRGAVNKKPNTWVPMDASYKQYTYTQGMDIKGQVPLDAQALITQAQTGATVDPSGWVKNINGAAIQTALTSYQTQVQNYINTTKPNATVGDVLGSKTIIPRNDPILLGTLPYTTIATGGKFTALPLQVRHQFEYDLYASALDRAMGSTVISLKQSLPSLAGKKITLSFAPATPADMALLNSYLPLPHANGTPILPSEFPTSLPGYLIRLTAEMRVDGQVVATGGTFTMGDELIASEGLFDPATDWDFTADTHPIAGEYIATHVDLQGVSPSQLLALQTKMTQTQTNLQALQFNGTKDDLTGDILYSTVLSYFAANYITSNISSRATGVVEYRKPSFGNFLSSAQTNYWFGIAKSVSFPGLIMDIQRYASMNVAKDNNPATAIAYNKQIGMTYSANEHIIPEQFFTNLADPNRPRGISTVKALSLAASQGQKIFTLNRANQAQQQTLLAQVSIDPQAMAEIQNALAAGKEVTVHASPVTQSGWMGSGYVITDPGTGAGAYKIAGGFNGGGLPWNEIGAGFGAMLDGLLAHYRDPGSMFGPDAEIAFSKFATYMGKGLSVLVVVGDIIKTLKDGSLSTSQQVIKIIGAVASAIVGSMIGAAAGAIFASPVGAVIIAMILVVLASILIDLLVNWIVGTLAFFRPFKYRVTYAT